AGVMAPTLGQDEIERRIAELRSVENWLNMNLNVLRATIHGLEMQKSGLAAMRDAAAMGNKAQDSAHPAGDHSQAPAEGRSNVPQSSREDPSKK
ncbi:MAG TPA: PhaM family polyhydroxyalkanoate granule multifunctional regulatory protein, partial [Burkholderiales bacterium]|nr:PhaM family polyhydroxyalkanoate granule multifunctional regulatory protein [Burkholderiales bacterium]